MKYIITIMGFFTCLIHSHFTYSNGNSPALHTGPPSLSDAVRDLLRNTSDSEGNYYVFMCNDTKPRAFSDRLYQEFSHHNKVHYCQLHASFIPYSEHFQDSQPEIFLDQFMREVFSDQKDNNNDCTTRRDSIKPSMPIPIPGVGEQQSPKCNKHFIPQTGKSFILLSNNLGNYTVPVTGENIILLNNLNTVNNQTSYRHQLTQLSFDRNNPYMDIQQDFYETKIYPLVRRDSLRNDDKPLPPMPIPIPGVGELAFFF